jgi:hypothetical protein
MAGGCAMKLIAKCAFFLALFGGIGSATEEKSVIVNADPLRLEVKFREKYLLGKEMPFEVELTNVSAKDVAVLRPRDREFDFILKYKDGSKCDLTRYGKSRIVRGARSLKEVVVKSKSTEKYFYNLIILYDVSLPGEYELTVRFSNELDATVPPPVECRLNITIKEIEKDEKVEGGSPIAPKVNR